MTTAILLAALPAVIAALPTAGSLVSMLIGLAIFAIVVCAFIAILKRFGITIDPLVYIILSAIASIMLLLFIARAFGYLG